MWLKRLGQTATTLPYGAVVSVVIIIVLAGLAWSVASSFTAGYRKGDGGIVIVDSPEVYSRERLINDRFRQVSWLETELDNADNQFFGNQAISDLRQIWGLETSVGVSNAAESADAPKAPAAGQPKAPNQPQAGADTGKEPSVSPNERFRDVLAYREEIRTEMMETLLDDRHDIKGNTLYRLKFDTTVLPEDNTEKLVVIQVVLSKADLCKDDSNVASAFPCMSVDTIHDEWIKQTELKINKAMEGTINYIRSMNLPEADFADFVRYLQGNAASRLDLPFTMDSDKRARTGIDEVIANVRTWDRLVVLDRQCLSKKPRRKDGGYSDRDLRSCYLPADTFYSPQAYRKNSDLYNRFRELLHRYFAKEFDQTRPFLELKSAHSYFNSVKKDRLSYDNLSEAAGKPIDDDIHKIIKQAENAELAMLRNVVANYYINKYTYSPLRKKEACDAFYENQLTVFEDKSLSCLAHLEKTTCLDVDHCAVRVTPWVPMPRRMLDCEPGADPEKDDCVAKKIRDRFKELLEYDEAYYSYAITPKERSQRILSIVSERRQKQLALSLLAKSSTALDAKAIESLTKVIADSSAHIEQIQRKPLILSFGRGQAVPVNPAQAPPDGIDFGWIVGPKFLVSSKKAGEVGFVHAPVQYSLSAVISVPSWWTAVKLNIDTCWIEQNQISQLVYSADQGAGGNNAKHTYIDNICDSKTVEGSHKNEIAYIARLPGSPAELPRKFGYEIERAPSIQDTRAREPLADLYVGQKNASLIVKGDELWRSTVVTMGNQKADNIEVLPNMKGIIARFNEVDIPDKKISNVPLKNTAGPFEPCVVYSRVVVWTSEGKTVQPLYVRIHPNPANKLHPQGFGDCHIVEQRQAGNPGGSAPPPNQGQNMAGKSPPAPGGLGN